MTIELTSNLPCAAHRHDDGRYWRQKLEDDRAIGGDHRCRKDDHKGNRYPGNTLRQETFILKGVFHSSHLLAAHFAVVAAEPDSIGPELRETSRKQKGNDREEEGKDQEHHHSRRSAEESRERHQGKE
ncbi:hypothetical protein ACFYT4_01995 [Streptomyces sp. NPDC004609]|uniref:hypothetical protein n=1 Tax=Streptomyces sp. NPDC004609 TaxID=3364704 RepID=UPI0036BE4085